MRNPVGLPRVPTRAACTALMLQRSLKNNEAVSPLSHQSVRATQIKHFVSLRRCVEQPGR